MRWRIVDPLLFLQTLRAIPTAVTRLDDIVYSEIRRELGLHNMAEIITDNREQIMEAVTKASYESTILYGIEIVDVRIKRVDLQAENEASIYARMQAERQRQANQYRSEGDEEAQKIVASEAKEKKKIKKNILFRKFLRLFLYNAKRRGEFKIFRFFIPLISYLINSLFPIYFCRASGILTEPSAC